jgi:hypothetical protein
MTLLRDLLGAPDRKGDFDPTWRTPLVQRLAGVAYEGDFATLPVLADALEDAGCSAVDLLAHLRGPGPHIRGCWALDRVRGPEEKDEPAEESEEARQARRADREEDPEAFDNFD